MLYQQAGGKQVNFILFALKVWPQHLVPTLHGFSGGQGSPWPSPPGTREPPRVPGPPSVVWFPPATGLMGLRVDGAATANWRAGEAGRAELRRRKTSGRRQYILPR